MPDEVEKILSSIDAVTDLAVRSQSLDALYDVLLSTFRIGVLGGVKSPHATKLGDFARAARAREGRSNSARHLVLREILARHKPCDQPYAKGQALMAEVNRALMERRHKPVSSTTIGRILSE
jgi:hypothetical protein